MVVTSDNEVCGQFNIIFKPLPQFNGKHVVFGRVSKVDINVACNLQVMIHQDTIVKMALDKC